MTIDGITWVVIIFYLILISYSYSGLESMATQILNPFDRDESDHPLDLYCYLNVFDTRYMVGRGFGERSNFVKSFEKYVIPSMLEWLGTNIPKFKRVKSITEKAIRGMMNKKKKRRRRRRRSQNQRQ